MSEASTGVDAEMRRLTLAVWGFFREVVEPTGMLPQRQTGCPKERGKKKTLENPTLFPWLTFKRQTLSSRFKLALSCGFLNWAAGSRLFPHRPMFCTSFGFEKNKGLLFLALITVVLNFQFFSQKLTQSCACILHAFLISVTVAWHICLSVLTLPRPRNPPPPSTCSTNPVFVVFFCVP